MQKTVNDDEDFSKTLGIAKSAMEFAGRFRTPPSPEVYEVWYRFVEGGNDSVKAALMHAIKVAKNVTAEQLRDLRAQFLENDKNTDATLRTSELIVDELTGIQSLIENQRSANQEYEVQLNESNGELCVESLTPALLQAVVQSMQVSNRTMRDQLVAMDAELFASQAKMRELEQQLTLSQKSMLTDPLTGVGNRRFFDTMMHKAVTRKNHETRLLYLMILDVDHFKDINDTLGHGMGDDYIKYIAHKVQEVASEITIARLGGDEFAMFLGSDSDEEAYDTADEIRIFFSENQLDAPELTKHGLKVTVSMGAAILRPDDDEASWYARADKLLYSAKQTGGNSVMVERILLDKSE